MPYKDPEAQREYNREYARRYRAEHPERVRELVRQSYANNRAQRLQDAREYRETHPDRWRPTPEQAREHTRRYREAHPDAERLARTRIRAAVFRRYGEACACCGTAEKLTIDHINGDGHEHRLELFGDAHAGGMQFYRWLLRMYLPPGYQTLCKRCNRSKADGERCHLNHRARYGK